MRAGRAAVALALTAAVAGAAPARSGPGSGPGPVTAADQAAIRRFLTGTLTSYVAHRDARDWDVAFTPATRRLLAVNQRLNGDEESEALGADPICGCQDWRTIRVRGIVLAPRPDGRVRATVRIVNFGPETRTFLMARSPAGWRVEDALEGGTFSLRGALERDNVRLRRLGRR